MSSILDALEKAEGERRQSVESGLRKPPQTSSRRGFNPPLTVGAVVLLLLVNLLFWWFYLRQEPQPVPSPVSPATTRKALTVPLTPASKPQVAAPVESPPPPVLSLREQLQKSAAPSAKPLIEEAKLPVKPVAVARPEPVPETLVTSQAPAVAEQPQAPMAPEPEPEPEESVPVTQAPVALAPPPLAPVQPLEKPELPVAPEEKIPLVWELPQRVREQVLSLKSSIHVYSEQPEQRFVIINMRRYSEGDSLSLDGFRLERIDQDGVVIDYGEGLVRLPRR